MKKLIETAIVLWTFVSWAAAAEYVSSIAVSADSSMVAYLISTERNTAGRFGSGAGIERAIGVAWCDSASPQFAKRLDIDIFGEYGGELDTEFSPGCIRFSPNGRKLAVLTLYKLTVIDLKFERELFSIDTEGAISSFHWLSDTELCYVKHEIREYGRRRWDIGICTAWPRPYISHSRNFWVLQMQAGARHIICSDEKEYHRTRHGELLGCSPLQPEVWSPDGRYVAYVSGWQVKVLRIRDRNLKSLGRAGFYTRIFWKADSSALFFADSEYRTAAMFKTATSSLTDFSDRLEYELGPTLEGLVLEGLTADGRFLVFNTDDGNGSYLVRLEPFKVIQLNGISGPEASLTSGYLLPAPMEETICIHGDGLSVARLDRNGSIGNLRRLLTQAETVPTFSPDGRFIVTRTSAPAGIRIHNVARLALLN